MEDNLERFVKAQQSYYQTALQEIKKGRKESHWMWFIFPQIKGLGYSETAKFYGIRDIREAKLYLEHPQLRKNLLEISGELLKLESDDAELVMGWPDYLKLRSSMTLFAEAEPDCEVFQRVLDKFFHGEKDQTTMEILEKQNHSLPDQKLHEKFDFRCIRPDEAGQAAEIEKICFPPNEACSERMMLERVKKAPEYFLVAVDKANGRVAGFLNGLATEETSFRDEFFTNADLHDPEGRNIMLLGLDVLPEYRRQGLASEIMRQYLRRQKAKNKRLLLLTCLQSKVKMYEKMGFRDEGIADSTWGGEEWHEMSCALNE